eukprot:13347-Heterococcus_DN1.PRE.3
METPQPSPKAAPGSLSITGPIQLERLLAVATSPPKHSAVAAGAAVQPNAASMELKYSYADSLRLTSSLEADKDCRNDSISVSVSGASFGLTPLTDSSQHSASGADVQADSKPQESYKLGTGTATLLRREGIIIGESSNAQNGTQNSYNVNTPSVQAAAASDSKAASAAPDARKQHVDWFARHTGYSEDDKHVSQAAAESVAAHRQHHVNRHNRSMSMNSDDSLADDGHNVDNSNSNRRHNGDTAISADLKSINSLGDSSSFSSGMHGDSIQQQQHVPVAAPLSSLLSLGPLPVLPSTQGNYSMNAAQRDCIEHERLLAADHMRKLNHALAGHLAYTDIRLDLTQLSLEGSSANNNAAANSNDAVHTPNKRANNSKQMLLAQSLQFTPTTPLRDVHVRNTHDQRFQHTSNDQHDGVNDDVNDDLVQMDGNNSGDQNTPIASQQQQQSLPHSVKSNNNSSKQQPSLRLDTADTNVPLQQQSVNGVIGIPRLHSPIAAVTPKRSRDNYGNLLFDDNILGDNMATGDNDTAMHRTSTVTSSLKRHSLQRQQLQQQQQHTKLYKDAETNTATGTDNAINNTTNSKRPAASVRHSRASRSSSACERCDRHHSIHNASNSSAIKKQYRSTSPTYSRHQHTSAPAVAQMAIEIESLKRKLAQLSSNANTTKADNASNGINGGSTGVELRAAAIAESVDWSQALLLQDRYGSTLHTYIYSNILCTVYNMRVHTPMCHTLSYVLL